MLIGRLCLVVLASALLVALPARAQTERRAPSLRFFTGVGVTGSSDLRIRQPALGTDLTFEQVAWEHKSLSTEWTRDSIPYVGARAEFFFREPTWLGVSVDVLHFKVFAPAGPARQGDRDRSARAGRDDGAVRVVHRAVSGHQRCEYGAWESAGPPGTAQIHAISGWTSRCVRRPGGPPSQFRTLVPKSTDSLMQDTNGEDWPYRSSRASPGTSPAGGIRRSNTNLHAPPLTGVSQTETASHGCARIILCSVSACVSARLAHGLSPWAARRHDA